MSDARIAGKGSRVVILCGAMYRTVAIAIGFLLLAGLLAAAQQPDPFRSIGPYSPAPPPSAPPKPPSPKPVVTPAPPSPPAAPQASEVRSTAYRNTEARVAVSWDVDQPNGAACVSKAIPDLSIQTAPTNGNVGFAATRAQPAGCPNMIDVMGVYYRPKPGFLGDDQFVYRQQSSGQSFLVTVIVTVVPVPVKSP